MINVTDLGIELDYMGTDCKQGYSVAIVVLRRNYMQKQPFVRVFNRRHTTLFQFWYDAVAKSYWRWNDVACLSGCSSFEDFKKVFRKEFKPKGVDRTPPLPPQTSRIQSFAKIVNSEKPLTIATQFLILDVCGDHSYASRDGVHNSKAPSCRLTILLKMNCFLEMFLKS